MDMRIISKNKIGKDYKKADFKDAKNLRKFVLALRRVVADTKKSRFDLSNRGSSISQAKSGEKIKKVAIVLREMPKLPTLGVSEQECGEIISREVLLADY